MCNNDIKRFIDNNIVYRTVLNKHLSQFYFFSFFDNLCEFMNLLCEI